MIDRILQCKNEKPLLIIEAFRLNDRLITNLIYLFLINSNNDEKVLLDTPTLRAILLKNVCRKSPINENQGQLLLLI